MDGWMEECTDVWMHDWLVRLMDCSMDRERNGFMDGRIDRKMGADVQSGRTDKWVNRHVDT